jgi:hypothetical protein
MNVSKRLILITVSLVGFAAVVYGLFEAKASNYLWYDFFTVGALGFLAPISYQLSRNTLLEFILRSPLLFVLLYLILFLVGSGIEFYGTGVADLWYYPHYSKEAQAIHSLVIGYPFAFLSLIPLYEIVEYVVLNLTKRTRVHSGQNRHLLVWIVLILVGLISVLAPVGDKYFAGATYVRHLSVIGMLGGIVLVDALRGLSGDKSLLATIGRGDYRYLLALVATSWLAAFASELPNTVPQTWIYHDVPFIQLRLLGVNVIVIFLGWIFLTFVPVSIFRFVDSRTNHHRIRQRHLCLERPAVLLGLHYVVFWTLLAVLLILMRLTLLLFLGVSDKYLFLTFLMAFGMVWIASEIIWSYHGLLNLQGVIRTIATPSKKTEVLTWYKDRVVYIYSGWNMAGTGLLIAGLFSPLIFKQKALDWTGSRTLFLFDTAYYLYILFLGGMSQFPFYGMSILAFSLPTKPLQKIRLFLTTSGDVRKFGRFFGLVGLGGLGLIAVAEVWLYVAPVKTVWLYVQLIITGTCIGAVLWFLLTQHNVHRLMVREKKVHLDRVCRNLNDVFQEALKNPSGKNYYELSILTSLKTQIEGLPDWPFSMTELIQLVTVAGTVATLVPLIEFFRNIIKAAK